MSTARTAVISSFSGNSNSCLGFVVIDGVVYLVDTKFRRPTLQISFSREGLEEIIGNVNEGLFDFVVEDVEFALDETENWIVTDRRDATLTGTGAPRVLFFYGEERVKFALGAANGEFAFERLTAPAAVSA